MIKIVVLIVSSLFFVGCGVNCKGEPPKRAIQKIETNNVGMQYHFEMYEPVGDAGHTPSLKCAQYEYGKSHLYTDSLGQVKGDNIIWNASYQGNTSSMVPDNILDQAQFIFGKTTVNISGLSGEYAYLNGNWKIENSLPDSWGYTITGN